MFLKRHSRVRGLWALVRLEKIVARPATARADLDEERAPEPLFEIFDLVDDLVRDAVLDRLGRRHPVVPVGVLADPFRPTVRSRWR